MRLNSPVRLFCATSSGEWLMRTDSVRLTVLAMGLLTPVGLRNFGPFIRKMCQLSNNTIFSLSSGAGKCGVSIIRVSGANAFSALRAVVGADFKPKPRYAFLKTLHNPKTKDVIDRGLVLWFPGPNSFTGEDSCEFQVHGSLAVIDAMLEALSNVAGLRHAKPGEFTKRAFFNGKLDLTEVEGLADLIHAETEAQRKQALLQSTGALSRLYKSWRQKLIRSVAHLEAYIDFAEDENIEDDTIEKLKKNLNHLLQEIRHHLDDNRRGEMLRDGVKTAIIGAPNVGKSSLLNLICQRKIAIVTSIAGTTRDIIESAYNIGGYPVVFADTAGLRSQTEDVIELEGINKAKEYLEYTDLILLVVDAINLFAEIHHGGDMGSYLKRYTNALGIEAAILEKKSIIVICNKIDLIKETEAKCLYSIEDLLPISCKENINSDQLLTVLGNKLKQICGNPTAENPRLTQSRYRHHLTECTEHLQNFLEYYSSDQNLDLAIAAQRLRKPVRCIEQITGNVSSDEILDVIFRDFCIGK